MKSILVVLLLFIAACAWAQNPALSSACGPSEEQFSVKKDKTQHTMLQPLPGKALIYFFQDAASARVGMDGSWIGANRGHGYFAASVEPGEHHLCLRAAVQDSPVELIHLKAEAGRTYYYRGRVVISTVGNYLFFAPIDNDEAGYLIGDYALSVIHRKQ